MAPLVRRCGLVAGCFALVTRVGCPGRPPPYEPDAGPDGGADAPIDAPLDGPIDAPPDAPPSTDPRITAVTNQDGRHQIRQSSFSPVVITGANLAGATSVLVGAIAATIDNVTATEVRATVFTGYGHPFGPVAVTVTTPLGTTIFPAALEVTPYVLSPAATPGTGRGTYESPMSLCDPALGDPPGPDGGDTMELLGGVHRCGRSVRVHSGVTVLGALDGSTVVQGMGSEGFGGFAVFAGQNHTSAFRRLTFAPPLAEYSIVGGGEGTLILEDITDAGGLLIEPAHLTIARYTFDGAGPAIDLSAIAFSLSDVAVRCQGGDGIVIRTQINGFSQSGTGTLEDVRVEGCARGLVSGPLPPSSQSRSMYPMLDIRDSEFVDNELGIEILNGGVTLHDIPIHGDAATAQPSSTGIFLRNGDLTMLGGEITGQSNAAIQAYLSLSGGIFEPRSQVTLDGVELVGGAFGINFHGMNGGGVRMHRSIVRDQTLASVIVNGYESFFDFGSPFRPGANALSVVSGIAFIDERDDPSLLSQYIEAMGTTLNGNSYAGQTIDGPASLPPDYEIQSFGAGIQF